MVAEEWPSGCRCRVCTLRKAATSGHRFGLPLVCPKCRTRGLYFGALKLPGEKVAPACPECGTALVSGRTRGQALVEFAFILPLLLFILLGAMESGFLLIEKAHQDRATYLVAEWAATHPNESWNAVANKELPGCEVEVSDPLPGLVQATSLCPYIPKVGVPLFDRIQISSREAASNVSPRESARPDPTPVASPS